jgi:hypothetical protein
VRGDAEHPFIARHLRAWASHYVIRPNVSCFLLEGLRVQDAAYGIYHPDYDAHVYRDIVLRNITAEPLNGGHDETSVPQGDFTYERLTFADCTLQREPLIQLTGIAPRPGPAGHFREVTLTNSVSREGGVVDFGGGPRTRKTEHPVRYFFHDTPTPGRVRSVATVQTPAALLNGDYRSINGWTGQEARAAEGPGFAFPQLLAPVDDLPPATLITSIEAAGTRQLVRGVSHDNGTVAAITVNGQLATITSQQAGVADWSIELDRASDGRYVARATDQAGNAELLPHEACQGSR